jgi:hypothetical protein
MQKFLIICLVIICLVVGIVGTTGLIRQQMIKANREALTADLRNMGSEALSFFNAPTFIGGGDGSWVPLIENEYNPQRLLLWLEHAGFKRLENNKFITRNGTFETWLTAYEDKILYIDAYGIQPGKNKTEPLKIRLNVIGNANSFTLQDLN